MRIRQIGLCIGVAVGIGLLVLIASFGHTLRKQKEGIAYLKVLAGMKIGTTTRDEFLRKMAGFKGFESVTATSSCYEGRCFTGFAYGLDNSVVERFRLFPLTVLAIGVYFDSNNTLQETMVTLDRYGVASATMDDQVSRRNDMSNAMAHWTDAQKLHVHLNQADRRDLTRIRVSCFTSWFGCNTAQELVSGGG